MAIISNKNLANGIDARSSKAAIKEGYSEVIENLDCSPGGYLSTRKGYQGHYGELPLRVKKYTHISDKIRLQFDSSQAIDLSNSTISPVIVKGRAVNPEAPTVDYDGLFVGSQDNSEWFADWELVNRQVVNVGSNTISVTQGEHGLSDYYIVGGAAISESDLSQSGYTAILDSFTVDTGTYDIEAGYISDVAGEVFFYTKSKSASLGSVYVGSFSSVSSVTIPAATHQLNNYNILAWVFESGTGVVSEVIPDSVTISAAGEVVVTFSSAISGHVILSCTDNYIEELNVAPGSTDITILNPGSPFNFINIYYTNAGVKYRVIPNSIYYDETSDSLTIDYTLGASAELVSVVWENANVVSNIIQLTDPTGDVATFTTYDVDMYVWGISHSGIYKRDLRGGHVNHIDTFHSPGEGYLIAGLGGNLFRETSSSSTTENLAVSGYPFMPTTYNFSYYSRVNAYTVLGPLFTTSANGRSRGEVVDTSITSDGYAQVTEVSVASATQFTVTLGFDSAVTLTGKIGVLDKLTLRNMPYGALNGDFSVVSVGNDSTTAPTITLSSTGLKTRWSSTGLKSQAACFTDMITAESATSLDVGSELSWESPSTLPTMEVVGVSGADIYINGISDSHELPDGLKLAGSVSTSTLVVGQGSAAITPYGIVVGDYITVGDSSECHRVLSMDTAAYSITVDKAVSVANEDAISVVGRWLPLLAPVNTTLTTTPATTGVVFPSADYDDQYEIKSTMMGGNLYFTNGHDEVMKWDGEHVYRAGLPRWQPMLFSTVDTSGGGIIVPTTTVGIQDQSGNRLHMDNHGDTALFNRGDRWYKTDDGIITVQDVNTADGYVYFTTSPGGTASGDLKPIYELRYFFRLRLVDANDNIIYSAATSSLDAVVEIYTTCNINWKIVGLPAIGHYDYARIVVDVFRTKKSTSTPYYMVGTINTTYDPSNPYLYFTDTLDDSILTVNDVDPLGPEVLSQTGEPIRASYISSVNNKLVAGNAKSFPKWEINLAPATGSSQLLASDLAGQYVEFAKGEGSIGDAQDGYLVDNVKFTFVESSTTTPWTVTSVGNASGRAKLYVSTSGLSLEAGDWVYCFHAAVGTDKDLTYSGWYKVYESGGTIGTYYITLDTDYVVGSSYPTRIVACSTPTEVPVWLSTDGNFATKEGNIASTTSIEGLAMMRLSMAINSVMKVADGYKANESTTVASNSSHFIPWLMARAGNDFTQLGSLMVEVPSGRWTNLQCFASSGANFSINNRKYGTGDLQYSSSNPAMATTYLWPSRVIASITNFPEVFEDPSSLADDLSLSAKDINSSDGQDLTALATFFGEAAFGTGAKLHDALIVFKENSIYAYDTEEKVYQKLDSRGKGCTAPKSVASTKNGLMFANESGVYRLNRDLSISFVGEFIDRLWRDSTNKAAVAEASGHQDRIHGKYKLGVASSLASYPDFVFAYDVEGGANTPYGAWTKYTNQAALMWANLDTDSFFASTHGRVFKIRNSGTSKDFRDDAAAIPVKWRTRPEDFGSAGIRKAVNKYVIEFQLDHTSLTDVAITSRTNIKGEWKSAGLITAALSNDPYSSVAGNIGDKKGNYVQLEVNHSQVEEELVITGLSWDVDGLTVEGIKEAADFT